MDHDDSGVISKGEILLGSRASDSSWRRSCRRGLSGTATSIMRNLAGLRRSGSVDSLGTAPMFRLCCFFTGVAARGEGVVAVVLDRARVIAASWRLGQAFRGCTRWPGPGRGVTDARGVRAEGQRRARGVTRQSFHTVPPAFCCLCSGPLDPFHKQRRRKPFAHKPTSIHALRRSICWAARCKSPQSIDPISARVTWINNHGAWRDRRISWRHTPRTRGQCLGDDAAFSWRVDRAAPPGSRANCCCAASALQWARDKPGAAGGLRAALFPGVRARRPPTPPLAR